jgi:hypothetical protein
MQRAMVAGAGFLVAAAVTVWGTFEEIMTSELTTIDPAGGGQIPVYSYRITWWALSQTTPTGSGPGDYGPYGIFLAAAAGVIMIAAVLTTHERLLTGATVCASLGIGIIAGAVGIRLMDAIDGLSQEPGPGQTSTFVIGLGIWLPAGAAVCGLAGLVFLLIPRKTETLSPFPR